MISIEITQEAYDALTASKFETASDAILKACPKKKAKFDPLQDVPHTVDFAAWSDWVHFRKTKRKPVSKLAAKKQWELLSSFNPIIQKQMIDSSIQNDYQGLFAPKGGSNGQNQPARVSHAQRSASDTEQLLAYANAIENGDSFMGANGPALPQSMDSCGGPSIGERQTVEEFQLVAEEDGTFIERGVYKGDGAL